MLSIPLWFVSERKQRLPPARAPCDDPGAMLAFSTTDKMSAFLSEREAGEWNLHLVGDREGLILIIAMAHNSRTESVCVDPESDGSGGQQVSLNDLMAFANSLR